MLYACERSWTLSILSLSKVEMSCANKQRLSTAECSKSTSSHRSSSVELTTCVVFLGFYPSLYTNMPTQGPPHPYAEWGQCLCRGFLTWGTYRSSLEYIMLARLTLRVHLCPPPFWNSENPQNHPHYPLQSLREKSWNSQGFSTFLWQKPLLLPPAARSLEDHAYHTALARREIFHDPREGTAQKQRNNMMRHDT